MVMEPIAVGTKRCRKCGDEKSVSHFNRKPRNSDGLYSYCKDCTRKDACSRYLRDPEPYKARASKWAAENPSKRKAICKKYRGVHFAEEQQYKRQYRESNRERIRASERRLYHSNLIKGRGKVRLREVRRKGASGSHTEHEWLALKLLYEYTCLRCGIAEPEISLTRDHVLPLVRGGSDNIDNIQPLCLRCNSSKKDRHIDYRGNSGHCGIILARADSEATRAIAG